MTKYPAPEKRSVLKRLYQPGSRYLLAVIALFIVETYALLANGAYFLGPLTLCIISLWLIAIGLGITSENLELFTRFQKYCVLLLIAFWLWTGLSFFWSITAELSWNEFNRTGAYLAVFLIGLAVGRNGRARNLSVALFVVAVSATAMYALGAKTFPALIENLENNARIAVPLGYVNGLGLLMALAFPASLYVAARRKTNWLLRLFSTLTAFFLLIDLFFTLSRGATFALLAGLVVFFSFVPYRLRGLGVTLLVSVPAIIIAWWSNGQAALMNDEIDLASRSAAASGLRIGIAIAVAAITSVFIITLAVGRRIEFPERVRKMTGTAAVAATALSVIAAVTLFISTRDSFTDWVSQSYRSFTSISAPSHAGTARLIETGSSFRWQLWAEALSNWKEHPFTGTGAQSFPITHLIYREPGVLFVKQAHGMPFGLLSELGLVGFLLMGSFVVLTVFAGIKVATGTADRGQKGLAGTLLAVNVVYLIHSAYDWDWNIFALTMIWFLFSGILTGWYGVSGGSVSDDTTKPL